MFTVPQSVADFLRSKHIVVAGVSRETGQASNAIYRKLRNSGYHVIPVNPRATQVEGVQCYPDLAGVPGPVDGLVVATHPDAALALVRQCEARGIRRIWFHRSFGQGSVSDAAVRQCAASGIQCIVGGCPLMYCEPVDLGHRCMKWWLRRKGRVPR